MNKLDGYEIIGEFASQEGMPQTIQSWITAKFVEDPADKRPLKNRWCVSLIDKCVELRPGDRVVVL